MLREQAEDLGKLILRVTIGLLLAFHLHVHLVGFLHGENGIGIRTIVEAWGLPAFIAYVAVFFETLGIASMVLGFYTRIGAAVIAVFMLGAVLMVHVAEVPGLRGSGNHLFLLGTNIIGVRDSYRLEIQSFYLFGAVAVALLGGGRYSLSSLLERPSKRASHVRL